MGEKRRQRRAAERAEREATAKAEPSAPAKLSVVPMPPKGEVGVSGTVNFHGRIHSESNTKLQWERAFGHPGSTQWGEWEKLEKTDHAVVAGLNLISAPLRDATVEIKPGEEDDEESQKIADFVRDNFKNWLDPLWPTLIEETVKGGLAYGFDIHEVVTDTRPDERVPGGLAVYVKKLAQRLPSSIKSDGWIEKGGELHAVRQSGWLDGTWKEGVELPASKILLATWNRSGNNYQGFSAFRSVWYIAQVRLDLLRAIAIGQQREALGIPVAKPGENTSLSKEQLDKLQEILENLVTHEHAHLILPKGVDFEWVYSPGANKGHVIDTWKALGLAILEVIQAQQMYLGTGETGSRSVGEVHDANKNGFVNGIRGWFEAVYNGVGDRPYTGIVRRLVDWNFGPQKSYPTLRLVIPKADVPVDKLAGAVKTLVDAKAITLTEQDENDLRDKVGLKPIDPEERAKELERRAAEAQATAEAMAAAGAGEDEEKPAAKNPPLRLARLAEAPGFSPWRELRPSEKHLALAEMDAFHTSARLEFERDVRDVLGDMVREALPEIEAAMADGDPSELNGLSLSAALLGKYVEVFVERCRGFGYRQAAAEKRRQPAGLARARAAVQLSERKVALLELGRGLTFEDGDGSGEGVGARVRKLVKAMVSMVTNRIRGRVKQQIQDAAIDAARKGESAGSVVERVVGELETSKALRTDAGMVVSRSFSTGREQLFEEEGGPRYLEVSEVMDRNTCDPCARTDGLEVEYGSPEHMAHLPPYSECEGGTNCRRVLIAIWET